MSWQNESAGSAGAKAMRVRIPFDETKFLKIDKKEHVGGGKPQR